jgi:hypothetical protein
LGKPIFGELLGLPSQARWLPFDAIKATHRVAYVGCDKPVKE